MNSRAKGYAYEAETARLWEAHGHRVEQLQRNRVGTGDHLITTPSGLVLAEETKRRERLDIPAWWRDAVECTPPRAITVLTFRQSRRKSLSVIETDVLAALLGGERKDGAHHG